MGFFVFDRQILTPFTLHPSVCPVLSIDANCPDTGELKWDLDAVRKTPRGRPPILSCPMDQKQDTNSDGFMYREIGSVSCRLDP